MGRTGAETSVQPLPARLEANLQSVYVGETVRLSWRADRAKRYSWQMNGKLVPAAAGPELVLRASTELNGKTVACTAVNNVGHTRAQLRLNIQCK